MKLAKINICIYAYVFFLTCIYAYVNNIFKKCGCIFGKTTYIILDLISLKYLGYVLYFSLSSQSHFGFGKTNSGFMFCFFNYYLKVIPHCIYFLFLFSFLW
jgi:hypothetical protein